MDNSNFRKMDEIEIEIEQIEDIRMLHIYELTGANVTDNKYGCTAIAVYYGDNKQLNYSEMDPYFDLLVNRVMKLYSKLSDKSKIMMDDSTRNILEGGFSIAHEHCFDKYIDCTPLEFQKLSIDATLSKRFAPLVEYLLVGLYKIFDFDLMITKRTCGWRGASLISGSVNDKPVTMYFNMERNDLSNYAISVMDFLKKGGELNLRISIDYNKLEIRYNSDMFMLYGETSFTFDTYKIRENHVAYFNDKQVFYDVNDYPNEYLQDNLELLSNNERFKSLINGVENIKAIYQLPFNMTYVIKEEITSKSNITTTSYSGTYLWQDALLADSRGWIQVQNIGTNIMLRTDSFFTVSTRLHEGKTQIYFVPDYGNATGKYKEKLEGNYFLVD